MNIREYLQRAVTSDDGPTGEAACEECRINRGGPFCNPKGAPRDGDRCVYFGRRKGAVACAR